jgi:hypothetical protein
MDRKYVDHPKYGSQPRYTGLDPDPNSDSVYLHWNTNILTVDQRRHIEEIFGSIHKWMSTESKAIKGTAIKANVGHQVPATVQVTHYYDIEKICRDCSLLFIFFAEEQKYWFEDLRFPLEADCVRCSSCRKKVREIQSVRLRYEQISTLDSKSLEELAEEAGCRLILVEEGVFHPRQLEKVRSFLNKYENHPTAEELRRRLSKLDIK